jgi:Domain of unknown function (DUF4296)
MRTFLLIVIISTLLIPGCKNKDAVPNSVLPRDKMQAVLWDMMRADQFLSDYVLNKDTSLKRATESIKLYQQVLAINGITKEKFERSFSYYKAHPILLKAIMDSIVNISPEDTVTKVAAIDTTTQVLVKDSIKPVIDSVVTKKDTTKFLKRPKKLIRAN